MSDNRQSPQGRFWRVLQQIVVRPHEDVRLALLFWGVGAVICLVLAIRTGGADLRAEAYTDVRRWLDVWLTGANVYVDPKLAVDYPPNALLILAPMEFLPAAFDELAFAICNAIACIAACWVLVSVVSHLSHLTLTRLERFTYVLMLLCFAPVRVSIWNGQTSPFVVMLCCVSIRMWGTSAILSGIFLGMGAAKPHVSLAFVLLSAYARRWTEIGVSIVTTLGLVLAYCWSVKTGPFDFIQQYWARLTEIYAGPYFIRGEVDLRPVFVDLFKVYGIGESIFLFVAAALLLSMLAIVWRARNIPNVEMQVLAVATMTCLAVFPFRRYSLLLIAPALLWTMWRPNISARQIHVTMLVIVLIALDVPFIIRHAIAHYAPSLVPYAQLANYLDRGIVVLFLVVSYRGLWSATVSHEAAVAR